MSDFDDELLELVEASSGKKDKKDRKRKRDREGKSGSSSKHSSSKRRKPDVSSDEPESEDETSGANVAEPDPYPLQGKYIDEADMLRLLALPEIQREEILATRMEERQKVLDKKMLKELREMQQGYSKGGAGEDGPTGVARAAKRQHTARGATKEKSSKLDELKAKRKAKTHDKTKNQTSPKRDHDRSSSPMEMETSSSAAGSGSESEEDNEEGVITKDEEEEEKERKAILSASKSHKQNKKDGEEQDETEARLEDLERIRLSRGAIAKHLLMPWFEQFAKGMWVKYLIGDGTAKEGNEDKGPVYRICLISEFPQDLVKPYRIDSRMYDRQAELVHGNAKKRFNLDKVSNTGFTMKEYNRLKATLHASSLSLPSVSSINAKYTANQALINTRMTESDVSAMLARSRSIGSGPGSGAGHGVGAGGPGGPGAGGGGGNYNASGAGGAGSGGTIGSSTTHWTKLERSRLLTARTLAQRRQDEKEVKELEAQIVEFDRMYGSSANVNSTSNGNSKSTSNMNDGVETGGGANDIAAGGTKSSSGSDVLMKLSEKNRKANAEAVRRAEQMDVERRRRERKAAQSATDSGISTPVPIDPSARLRTVPRTSVKAGSKAGTPGGTPGVSRSGTPSIPTPKEINSPSPLAAKTKAGGTKSSFEAKVISDIEVDLGDF